MTVSKHYSLILQPTVAVSEHRYRLILGHFNESHWILTTTRHGISSLPLIIRESSLVPIIVSHPCHSQYCLWPIIPAIHYSYVMVAPIAGSTNHQRHIIIFLTNHCIVNMAPTASVTECFHLYYHLSVRHILSPITPTLSLPSTIAIQHLYSSWHLLDHNVNTKVVPSVDIIPFSYYC